MMLLASIAKRALLANHILHQPLKQTLHRELITATFASLSSSTSLNITVKGDPNSRTLADCPYCHRVLLTLETKNISYNLDYVDFDHKPEWLMKVSEGKVPVLRHGDVVLPDSEKITTYLEEKFPEPSMVSKVPPRIAALGTRAFVAFRGIMFSSSPEEEAEKKLVLEQELQKLHEYLKQNGPLFGGKVLDATDAALAPKLYHLLTALPHFKNYHIPERFSAVHTYMATMRQLPAFKKTDYGAASIVSGWERHLREGH